MVHWRYLLIYNLCLRTTFLLYHRFTMIALNESVRQLAMHTSAKKVAQNTGYQLVGFACGKIQARWVNLTAFGWDPLGTV